ncbi:MAG: CPBP family intramembrane metalloprotease [Verrucomicrobiae bacterium]|nr:CPBP family intramembrane metalloprotease [Verrucomicrobiae bacterium]
MILTLADSTMAERAANAVLRDFENLAFIALALGLAFAVAWRFFFPRDRAEVAAAPNAADEPRARRVESGVPVDHFSVADLLISPLVLVKYSVVIQGLMAGALAMLGLSLSKAGAVPDGGGGSAAQGAEKVAEMSNGMLVVVMAFEIMLGIMLVSLIVVMIQWVGRRDPVEVFGLRRLRWPKLLLWIVAGAMVTTPVVVVITDQMGGVLEELFGGELGEQAAVESLRQADNWLSRGMMVLNACLVAPIVEEFVFRGFLYGLLKRFTGAMFAAFVSAALFAVAHQNINALAPLWGFALFQTLFYESSRCLWVPIGVHALFNMVNIVNLFQTMGAPANG